MVASTDIKFYVHTNNNAPQLQNAYGSMINVLDACLINGFQIGVVSSLTASGNTVTATFGAAHNLMQYQVIKITGAAQAEFNGEHRILTIPDSSSLTFELASAPSVPTATGAISASLPPLGWEKPFSSSNPSGGGKAAYRSTNLILPGRPFLRVVDEPDPAYNTAYAKFAKVGIVEDMTDIDMMLGVQAPYDAVNPDKNWVGKTGGTAGTTYNGWARWYYASGDPTTNSSSFDTVAPTSGDRRYIIIGNDDYFYILNGHTSADVSRLFYGFGGFNSYLNTDSACTFLSATTNYVAANASEPKSINTPCTSLRTEKLVIQRKYTQELVPVLNAKIMSMNIGSTTHSSGDMDYVLNAEQLGFKPFTHTNIFEGSVLRGSLKELYWLFQNKPYSDLQALNIANKAYLAINCMGYNTAQGQIVVGLGDL